MQLSSMHRSTAGGGRLYMYAEVVGAWKSEVPVAGRARLNEDARRD